MCPQPSQPPRASQSPQSSQSPPFTPPGPTHPHGRPACVLSVEDDPVIRQSIAAWLADEGYLVMEAEDGISALRMVREHRPDVVLLDLGIPGISGDAVLERMAQESPEVPVVVVSGRAEIGDAINAFKLGAWDYITKPILNMNMLALTVRNCLERRRLRERLSAMESRYSGLVQGLPVVVFSLDDTLELTFVNEACRTVLGWTPEQALLEPGWFMANVFPEDRARVRGAFSGAFSASTPFALEFRMINPRGLPLFVQARSTAVASPDLARGMPGRIEGVLIDLSRRVFLERLLVQREKLNTLGALVDEIAHEFRNPVFALAGFARTLLRKFPDAHEAEVVLEEATRLEALINRVQQYLAPVDIAPRPCSLAAVLDFAADLLHAPLQRKGVELRVEAAANLPPVQSDPDLLTQIVVGMAGLAVEHGAPGSETVLRCRDAGRGQLVEVLLRTESPLAHDAELSLMPFGGQQGPQPLAVSYKLARDLSCLLHVRHEPDGLMLMLAVPVDPNDVADLLAEG